MQAKPILQIPNTQLGEGPVWDYRIQKLWWTDIKSSLLHCFDPESGENKTYKMNQMIGTPIPCKSGGLILAMHHGFAFFDPETEKLTPIADPESDLPNNRFNDGKCDPIGRFWAGTMAIDKEHPPTGNLYRMDRNLEITKQLTGIKISNGLAWTKDGKRMYYIDTVTQKVQAFHYNVATGDIEKDRDVLSWNLHYPDGMCIDENDNLWIAFYGSARVCCYDPRTGKELVKIEIPTKNPTSCTFGGKELDTLFITSAAHEKQEFGGTLFSIKPGVKGRKAIFFDNQTIK